MKGKKTQEEERTNSESSFEGGLPSTEQKQ
jgi:hypothetical protein